LIDRIVGCGTPIVVSEGDGQLSRKEQMVLRSAEPGEELAVAEVHVRSWQVAYRGLLPNAYLDGLRPEDRAARYIFGKRTPDQPETVIALEDGSLRGFATLGHSRDPDRQLGGELYALYVDPAFWGTGVGRGLMIDARGRLMRRGYVEAHLWVLVGNARAERFYQADGWSPDGSRRAREVHGVKVDELRYRIALG
jgi:GNAT superfamily N-acetyltransferase